MVDELVTNLHNVYDLQQMSQNEHASESPLIELLQALEVNAFVDEVRVEVGNPHRVDEVRLSVEAESVPKSALESFWVMRAYYIVSQGTIVNPERSSRSDAGKVSLTLHLALCFKLIEEVVADPLVRRVIFHVRSSDVCVKLVEVGLILDLHGLPDSRDMLNADCLAACLRD